MLECPLIAPALSRLDSTDEARPGQMGFPKSICSGSLLPRVLMTFLFLGGLAPALYAQQPPPSNPKLARGQPLRPLCAILGVPRVPSLLGQGGISVTHLKQHFQV